jgi:hypothetical protein
MPPVPSGHALARRNALQASSFLAYREAMTILKLFRAELTTLKKRKEMRLKAEFEVQTYL